MVMEFIFCQNANNVFEISLPVYRILRKIGSRGDWDWDHANPGYYPWALSRLVTSILSVGPSVASCFTTLLTPFDLFVIVPLCPTQSCTWTNRWPYVTCLSWFYLVRLCSSAHTRIDREFLLKRTITNTRDACDSYNEAMLWMEYRRNVNAKYRHKGYAVICSSLTLSAISIM